jgi:serine/threonine-protein kinase
LSSRFRILAFIGEGAMANVYRGQDLSPGPGAPSEVAIKIMHPALMADGTFVQRFWREAKAAKRLKHPNTVQVIEYGVDKELLFIAMELLSGKDLFEVLQVERRLSESKAARVMIQVCDALIAAHAEGIVHRDLKPENIMVVRDSGGPDGLYIKVLDFGIAKIMEREDEAPPSSPNSMSAAALTSVGVVVGTPSYMSPEQCRGDAIDPRSDIYSSGVLLYQLLTGRVPFSGKSPVEIAMQQLQQAPPPPSELVLGLHPGLEATVLTALSKWPTARQQSALELKQELEQVLNELASDLSASSGQELGAIPISGREHRALMSSAPPPPMQTSALTSTQDPPHAQMPPAPTQLSATAPSPELLRASSPHPVRVDVVTGSALALEQPPMPLGSSNAQRSPTVRRRSAVASKPWLLVPLAVVFGMAMGAVAFLIFR